MPNTSVNVNEGVKIFLPKKPIVARAGGITSVVFFLVSVVFAFVWISRLPPQETQDNSKKSSAEQEKIKEERDEKTKKARKFIYMAGFSLLISIAAWIGGRISTASWKEDTQQAILTSGYPLSVVEMLLKNQTSQGMNESIKSVGKSLTTGLIASSLLK